MASQPGSSGRQSMLGETVGWRCREWGSSTAWEDGQQGLGTAFYSDQTRQRTKHELGVAGAAPLPTRLQVPKVPHRSISPAAECLHMGGLRPRRGTLWCPSPGLMQLQSLFAPSDGLSSSPWI